MSRSSASGAGAQVPVGSLNAEQRARDLDALAAGEVFDVLVVGGGITGAGVALEAATRGLRVALLERGDLAAGTSRWSSKLVHGGLRYLATGDVGVAAESARERHVLATVMAPHLVRPLPFVMPFGSGWGPTASAAASFVGMEAADALRRWARTPDSVVPAPRSIDATQTLAMVPGLASAGLARALVSTDLQLEDDVRLVVTVARTAASHGARILTDVDVQEVGPGGVLAHDRRGGGRFEARARTVVNATGVWAAELDHRVALRPSRGSHVVLAPEALGHPTGALTVPMEFGRFLFALPTALGPILLGITDVPHVGSLEDVQPSESEVGFLLGRLSTVLDRPVEPGHVLGSFAGLRPLVAGEGESADLSRRHAVLAGDGLVTVVGGKLTTFRRMAQDAVDLLTDVPSVTADLPLIGAGPRLKPVARATLPPRLLRRFGSEASMVAALDPDPRIAEIAWAIRHEGAPDEVCARRDRLREDIFPGAGQPVGSASITPATRSARSASESHLVT